MENEKNQIRETLTDRISERDFLTQVIDLAHVFRWKVAHFRPAKTEHGWRTAVQADGVGFPDLVMVRPPRLLFCELKSEKGNLTVGQETWLKDLAEVPGVEVFLWRPSDYEEMAAILK